MGFSVLWSSGVDGYERNGRGRINLRRWEEGEGVFGEIFRRELMGGCWLDGWMDGVGVDVAVCGCLYFLFMGPGGTVLACARAYGV